ncbi:MAG: hypothetical protein IT438_09170 [Phycisphaerales bacterium]|nr:hypothetical protein [Phycisphaerales bacterium]
MILTLQRIGCVVAAIASLVGGGGVAAQTSPQTETKPAAMAVPAGGGVSAGGHGWACLVEDPGNRTSPYPPGLIPAARPGSKDGTIVLHLPPRGASGGLPDSSEGGVARLAPGFQQPVERMAWWGTRVYFVLKEERLMATEQRDWQRRVLSVTASPSGPGAMSVGGSGTRGISAWDYPPNRPELVGVLPGKVELTGFGASRLGPVALTRAGRAKRVAVSESGAGRGSAYELSVCVGANWRSVELPWARETGSAVPGSTARYWVLSARDGVALAVLNNQSDDTLTVWSAELPSVADEPVPPDGTAEPAVPPAGSPTPPWSPSWKSAAYSLRIGERGATGEDRREVFPGPDHVVLLDEAIFAATWEAQGGAAEGGTVRLAALRPDRADEYKSENGIPRSYGFVPMDGDAASGGARLIFIWTPAAGGTVTESGISASSAMRIREVSAATGRVLFEGPFMPRSWMSMSQYRVLALSLVAIMAAVLLFVLRRGPGQRGEAGPRTKPD